MKEESENDEYFDKSEYYETDGTPSVSKVAEVIYEKYCWGKLHYEFEDLLGEDSSEEEYCLDDMTDDEVIECVKNGCDIFKIKFEKNSN